MYALPERPQQEATPDTAAFWMRQKGRMPI